MTDQPHPASFAQAGDDAAPAILPQTADPARHDGWTPARQAAFLRELAATHNVSAAARAVGMGRQSAYKLRARLRGTPFDMAWEAAFATRFDVLAEAALDRALNGVEVPHYYNGELVGTSRKYDERLTLALLALRRDLVRKPKYDFLPEAAYATGDLAALADRVERGPAHWLDDAEEERDARDEAEGEDE
ncbi:hypothetical protein [Qipengyuania sp.]|uniref:hypothetical protein n=1 Tax=Qipengyuania sp. TaxID=2004515 RepID=UPI003AF539A3